MMYHRLLRSARPWQALALLGLALAACDDTPGWKPTPAGPSAPGGFAPVIHTNDGRHLKFEAGSFQPSAIDHCRDDGRRHLTSIYDLVQISPMSTGPSLCPEFSGAVLRLHLFHVNGTALKVSTHCPDGCVTPGGYYPPLGTNVYVPWGDIYYIEFRRQDAAVSLTR
ncbi:MAG: hypothetical protein JSU87_11310 [Gemmatimonadota bacterium]|nr:MAG: hypothetical protein JSU87_11310 [Gemmatimonadota bacterium]